MFDSIETLVSLFTAFSIHFSVTYTHTSTIVFVHYYHYQHFLCRYYQVSLPIFIHQLTFLLLYLFCKSWVIQYWELACNDKTVQNGLFDFKLIQCGIQQLWYHIVLHHFASLALSLSLCASLLFIYIRTKDFIMNACCEL